MEASLVVEVGLAFTSTFGKMAIIIVVERLVYCIIPICLIVSTYCIAKQNETWYTARVMVRVNVRD